jgi:hypothetical protein
MELIISLNYSMYIILMVYTMTCKTCLYVSTIFFNILYLYMIGFKDMSNLTLEELLFLQRIEKNGLNIIKTKRDTGKITKTT